MNAKEVPAHPNLEQYKKQAKDLVKARKSGDPERCGVSAVHLAWASCRTPSSKFKACPGRRAVHHCTRARFRELAQFANTSILNLRLSDSLWESAKKAVITGDVSTLERLLRENVESFSQRQPPAYVPSGPGPHYAGADARTIIAREHDFESFDEFARHFEARNNKTSLVSQFESAVEAVISGDLATLERLLRLNPALIRARSTRRHHATLLHYVGANGVEGFRQKTPKNAVAVAEMLLKAGAEVDAVAEMYGGSTTLGLVATSIHPWLAGVQGALMEILLDHGAAIDQPGAAGNGQGVVNGCLANGRLEAAELLAARGAPLDLEGASGVGRLDLVKSFFNEDGSLKSNATTAQMKSGFNWACEYGRTSVVDFLLRRASMQARDTTERLACTGLRMADTGISSNCFWSEKRQSTSKTNVSVERPWDGHSMVGRRACAMAHLATTTKLWGFWSPQVQPSRPSGLPMRRSAATQRCSLRSVARHAVRNPAAEGSFYTACNNEGCRVEDSAWTHPGASDATFDENTVPLG